MGVVNVTPDSFYDGGRHADAAAAIAHARQLAAEGADLLDVGGESSRPGAASVTAEEELARLLPVLEGIADLGVPVSVDTTKPEVMRAVLARGAAMINDITALAAPGALEVVAASDAAVCLMHMQGSPRTMQADPTYADVIAEVRDFLAARAAACVEAGIARERIVVDPGFGFGKTVEHNFTLLARLGEIADLASRCSPAGRANRASARITGRPAEERFAAASPRRCSRCSAALESCACTTSPRRATRWRCSRPWRGGHEPEVFRHRRRARQSRRSADHAGFRAAARLRGGRGARTTAQRPRAAGGADRQGHADLGLHARGRARGGVCRRRGRRDALRPDAHSGGRLPHPRAAAVGGHRHQRLAQSVSRQRHQVLLRRRREAARRDRTGDRARARAPARVPAGGRTRQGAPRGRRARALHRVLQEHVSERARPSRPAHRGRLRARRRLSRRATRLPRARCRRDRDRRRAERVQHQRAGRCDEPRIARGGGDQASRRRRHRARRRRRPAVDGRRVGWHVRRRSAAVRDRFAGACRTDGSPAWSAR